MTAPSNLSAVDTLVLLLPIAIPFVVDLVTKSSAPPAFKAGVALFLSAVLGAVQTAVVTDGETWQAYVAGILYSAVLAFVTHYTGVTNPVERATARFGLTSSHPPADTGDVDDYYRSATQTPVTVPVGTLAIGVTPDLSAFADSLERTANAIRAVNDYPTPPTKPAPPAPTWSAEQWQ